MTYLPSHTHFTQTTNLFRFCLRVLELRRPSQKINDQHLGQLLNLSPSDTSHWKRGKKVFKDTKYIRTLSQNLNVDAEILQDLADGSIELAEAWCEFNDAEEESSKDNNNPENSSLCLSASHHLKNLEIFASRILNEISFQNIPVCVITLLNAFPFIHLLPSDSMDTLAKSSRIKPGSYVIRYAKGNIRPHTRLAIAREIANIILASERERYQLLPCSTAHTRAEIVTLSNAFLMPGTALASEFQKVSIHSNLFKNLAETFGVPKSAMRKRLATLLSQSATFFN